MSKSRKRCERDAWFKGEQMGIEAEMRYVSLARCVDHVTNSVGNDVKHSMSLVYQPPKRSILIINSSPDAAQEDGE
jgi:hypothetical protein